MFRIRIIRLTACVAGLFAAAGAAAENLSETGEFLDGIAAVVNEGVVLRSQLREQTDVVIKRATSASPPIPLPPAPVLREQLLEQLILKEIQLQRADRIGLQISDDMLNQAIANIAAQNNVPFEQLPALLAEDGVDYADFRRQLREELTLDQLRRIDVGQRISVSPRELENCLADLEGNVAVNSDYRLSHILISMPQSPTSAQLDEARGKAEDVYRQLQDGADFREMALRYSDAENAMEGGSLGWLQGSQLPTFFTDVVAGLDAGEISEPFRSASSFHIVKVDEMRSANQRSEVDQVRVRHILVEPNEIVDDQTAKQQLDDALARIREGEDFGELAKVLSDDPGSATQGGELPWASAGTFAPEFEATIAESEIGRISEPFRTVFGWHILEVLERRVYDNTEDVKRGNCIGQIRAGKMDEETQLWMRRLRDEAFVDSRL